MNYLVIFAKYPEVGKVKTRLGSDIGLAEATALYSLFVQQTCELVQKSPVKNIFVAFTPGARKKDFYNIIPKPFKLLPQEGANLGERMLNAFAYTFREGASSTVILGSDSPTLPPKFLSKAFTALSNHDVVLGPAEDGGYYLIGANKAHAKIFSDIKWSSRSVLKETLRKTEQLNLRCRLLDRWYDIDNMKTLIRAANDDKSGRIRTYLQKNIIDFLPD